MKFVLAECNGKAAFINKGLGLFHAGPVFPELSRASVFEKRGNRSDGSETTRRFYGKSMILTRIDCKLRRCTKIRWHGCLDDEIFIE